jgi:hypothetical protein
MEDVIKSAVSVYYDVGIIRSGNVDSCRIEIMYLRCRLDYRRKIHTSKNPSIRLKATW